MKTFLHLTGITLVLLFVNTTCKKEQEQKPEPPDKFYLVDVKAWQKEAIILDSFLINGKCRIIDDLSNVINALGKPDHVFTDPVASYYFKKKGYEPLKCYVFGQTLFDVIDSTAFLRSLELTDSVNVVYKNNIIINNHLNAKDIQKIFNEASKLGSRNGHGRDAMAIPIVDRKAIMASQMIFLYKGNYVLERLVWAPSIGELWR